MWGSSRGPKLCACFKTRWPREQFQPDKANLSESQCSRPLFGTRGPHTSSLYGDSSRIQPNFSISGNNAPLTIVNCLTHLLNWPSTTATGRWPTIIVWLPGTFPTGSWPSRALSKCWCPILGQHTGDKQFGQSCRRIVGVCLSSLSSA